MNEADLIPGARVRVSRDIVIGAGQSPCLTVPMGRTGTVERFTGTKDALCLVLLDEAIEVLGVPRSALVVWDESVPECTAEDFELIPEALNTDEV